MTIEDSLVSTYQELFDYIKAQERAVNEDYQLCSVSGEPLDLRAPVEPTPAGEVLSLKWKAFAVTIKDAEDLRTVKGSDHLVVGALKERFIQETGKSLGDLSYLGRRLEDGDMLMDSGVKEGALLVGKIRVSVVDDKCGLSTEVLATDFLTVKELKRLYSQTSRRTFNENASFFYKGQPLDNDQTLYALGIGDEARCLYENPAYTVFVLEEHHEAGSGKPFSVADHYTVGQLKQLYSTETRQALQAGDKLIFEMEQLDDDSMLYRCGLKQGCEVRLKLQDASKTIVYECGGERLLERGWISKHCRLRIRCQT